MKRPKRLVVDRSKLFDGIPSVGELLAYGNKAEVRQQIEYLATVINSDQVVKEPWKSWIVAALWAISKGDDANRALGLRRKNRYPVRDLKFRRALVEDLRRQGTNRDEALHVAAQFNPAENTFTSEVKGDALKKALGRFPVKKSRTT